MWRQVKLIWGAAVKWRDKNWRQTRLLNCVKCRSIKLRLHNDKRLGYLITIDRPKALLPLRLEVLNEGRFAGWIDSAIDNSHKHMHTHIHTAI